MRLFVALNLPEEERARIHEAAARLRDQDLPVRWVEPEKYHLTLKFLGEVDEELADEVGEHLDRVAASNGPFELSIDGFGAFPTIRRPRVLWMGVEASPALRCLKQDVEWALAESGFERDARAFHPHITLGRASRDGAAGAFRGVDELVADMDYRSLVPARSLDLMRSRLTREGPHYSIVRTSSLGSDG